MGARFSPRLLLLFLISLSSSSLPANAAPSTRNKPHLLPAKIDRELAGYQDVVEQIVKYAVDGPGQNQSYDRLATFTDAFGSRLSGIMDIFLPNHITRTYHVATRMIIGLAGPRVETLLLFQKRMLCCIICSEYITHGMVKESERDG